MGIEWWEPEEGGLGRLSPVLADSHTQSKSPLPPPEQQRGQGLPERQRVDHEGEGVKAVPGATLKTHISVCCHPHLGPDGTLPTEVPGALCLRSLPLQALDSSSGP